VVKKYIYGIDFGTTNSALSILDTEENKIVKTFSEASILFFIQPEGSNKVLSYVGQQAIDAYLDNRMSGRFMKSVKRVLPRTSFVDTRVYTQKHTATSLVALVLKYLKDKADDFLGESVSEIILGRPVVFDEDPAKDSLAQERLEKAALAAGFTCISFQMEPIAAAFTYERTLARDEKVLVADIGGGTSDFTVMNLGPGKYKIRNRKEDMIAQGGIYIGGDNFDSSFMSSALTPYFGKGVLYESSPGKMLEVPGVLFDNITSWEKMNFFNVHKLLRDIDKYYVYARRNEKLLNLKALLENNLGYSVFREIEKTKIQLSGTDDAMFGFEKEPISISKEVSISYYNGIINANINKIGNYLDSFLQKNGIAANEIDTVFITGGSAQVRAIKELMVSKFGEAKLRSGDYLNSVSQGLAWSFYN
jgi:hypothetical chaperone protein